jgi:riboflavin synthase
MFTGIIESVGTVRDLAPSGGGERLQLATSLAAEVKPGDSLAVNGVCLTVVTTGDAGGGEVSADIGPETARVTNLSTLAAGAVVNLERPMRFQGRVDGHLVLGHVDGTGQVEAIRADGDSHWVTIAFPRSEERLVVLKGSIAVDGVSLTVAALGDGLLDVQIVPYTWMHTTFSRMRPGDKVNLEYDMIGKYVLRALDRTGRV